MSGRKKKIEANIPVPVVDLNYEILTEYANIFFWSINEDGIILFINDCFAEALGYTKQELVGTHAYKLAPEYNSDGIYQWDRIDEVKNNPLNPPVRIFELRCKKGGALWIELRPRVLVMPATKKFYSIAVGIDVSERRKMEQKLKHIHTDISLSVFFNNALEKRYSFSEICHYTAAIDIELLTPIVCLFLQPQSIIFPPDEQQQLMVQWKQKALQCLQPALAQNNVVMWDRRDGIAALVSLTPEQAADHVFSAFEWQISEEIAKREFPMQMVLGVSDVWITPQNISAPFDQARMSAIFGAITHPEEFVHYWKKLGVLKILLDINDSIAEKYIEDHLGPLLNLSSSNQNELLHTLCEILSANSVSHVANRLHYHRKTIAYRKERLEKLLHVTLDDALTRTDLLVALRLYQIQKQKSHAY